jgi:hypothetical protein
MNERRKLMLKRLAKESLPKAAAITKLSPGVGADQNEPGAVGQRDNQIRLCRPVEGKCKEAKADRS